MTYTYGIDPGASSFALAVYDTDLRRVVHTEQHQVAGAHSDEARVAALFDIARERLTDIAEVFPGLPPSVVGIEQPAGRFPNPKLMAGWSAVTIASVKLAGEAVVWMTPPDWHGRERGVALADFVGAGWDLCGPEIARLERGRGRVLAKRHPLRRPEKQASLAIARVAGYDGWDDNVADACCVALAAARRLTRARGVAA